MLKDFFLRYKHKSLGNKPTFDRIIFLVALSLLLISLVLISSASVHEAFVDTSDSAFYLKRQLINIAISLVVAFFTCMIATSWFKQYSFHLIFIILISLVLVLIVGREINHAKRWISLGFMNIQPAEFLKLFWILYFSGYASRKIEEVRNQLKGFIKPLAFLALISGLLLLQPDFGSLVVVTAITFGILFVAGARLLKYIVTVLCLSVVGGLLIWIQPYRMARVMSFLNPWEDEFGSGYQLTQSLIAFGRGGFTGQGLGNSVQKLGYLPESHTDFVTAILGEELGFVGMCVIILLEFIIVYKAISLSFSILRTGPIYQGFVSFGIGLWFCLQTVINIGAASGALPTKGLTLPLVSYGGSSLIVFCAAISILLRIDFEWRNKKIIWDKYEK